MQSFTRRLRGRPGAPLAIGFGLLTVCACGPDRIAAIPAVTTATGSAAIPVAARGTVAESAQASVNLEGAGRRQFTAASLEHRASSLAVKIAGPYAGLFHQVTFGVDVLVTANQVFEP